MHIETCPACRGNGMRCPSMERCMLCKGTGYPAGYIPPTIEECNDYAFPGWRDNDQKHTQEAEEPPQKGEA